MDDHIGKPPIRLVKPETWMARLLRGDKGILPTLSNALVIMANDPELADLLAFNTFTNQHLLMRPAPPPQQDAAELAGPYPRPWTNEDVTLIQSYMQRIWSPGFARSAVEDAVRTIAAMKRFHPVRDWLATLRWDGRPRIHLWLTRTFGCPDDDYHRAVGSKLMIAAVRRVRQPGVKFDHLVVLEGGQGIGKSTALVMLFGQEWTTDDLPTDLGNKDAAIGLCGAWCIELAEIEQLIRSEAESVKAFLSRSIDRYRPPYGSQVISVPRQSVMVGTTNSTDYLRDATGNRRIWPVECLSSEAADLDWIADERDQLWAEAAQLETANGAIWLENGAVRSRASHEQAERIIDDPWDQKVRDYVEYLPDVTIPVILERGLYIDVPLQSKAQQMRVANILKIDGWKRGKPEWDASKGKIVRSGWKSPRY